MAYRINGVLVTRTSFLNEILFSYYKENKFTLQKEKAGTSEYENPRPTTPPVLLNL